MKLRVLIGFVVAVGATLFAASGAFSRGAPRQEGQQEGQEEEMMKRWMAAATPGEPHAFLQKYAGSWQTETKCADEKGGMQTSAGTSTWKAVLGGRFIHTHYKGEMMGTPFEGTGYIGFDNTRKQYTLFWIDSMGTQMLTAQGTMKPGSGVVNFFGTMDDPCNATIGTPVRYTYRFAGEKIVFEMGDPAAGHDHKMIEIVHTRAKP